MIKNSANYRVGDHLLLTDNVFEAEILDKKRGWLKILILTDGWFGIGGIHWLPFWNWSVLGKLKQKPGKPLIITISTTDSSDTNLGISLERKNQEPLSLGK